MKRKEINKIINLHRLPFSCLWFLRLWVRFGLQFPTFSLEIKWFSAGIQLFGRAPNYVQFSIKLLSAYRAKELLHCDWPRALCCSTLICQITLFDVVTIYIYTKLVLKYSHIQKIFHSSRSMSLVKQVYININID